MFYAVESNCRRSAKNADIINLLIKSGADIRVKNPDDETVLDAALACTRGDVINDLLKACVTLWTPQVGEAAVFFFDNGLKVDINVGVGS